MKSIFAGYYRPTDKEFDELWKTCVFIFDTSVLLDLYRSTAKTREVLFSILEKIKDRIWLPYQAGWEYQEDRLDVIAKERGHRPSYPLGRQSAHLYTGPAQFVGTWRKVFQPLERFENVSSAMKP
jgi:hypothetical protein